MGFNVHTKIGDVVYIVIKNDDVKQSNPTKWDISSKVLTHRKQSII
jgi:hypothetical protein